LENWLRDLEPPRPGTTYLNFTASHDGIGVRPLEGLVSADRLERLCRHVRDRGGRISTRQRADGSDAPYELNITYVDALAPHEPDDQLHARRFLATQAVMLALQGMPAVYFHSLVGTQNDYAGLEASGQPRRINRRKFMLDELRSELHRPLQRRIYEGYRHLLDVRVQQPAFHPDAAQRLIATNEPALLAFERSSMNGDQQIVVMVNFSAEPRTFSLPSGGGWRDLITDQSIRQCDTLAPAQAVWLVQSPR
jgi:sucrose phosphorylase